MVLSPKLARNGTCTSGLVFRTRLSNIKTYLSGRGGCASIDARFDYREQGGHVYQCRAGRFGHFDVALTADYSDV